LYADVIPPLNLLQQPDQNLLVRIAVGRIRQDDDGLPEAVKELPKGLERSPAIRKRRVSFRNLVYHGSKIYLLSLPVAGQPLQEVVAFDVAIVVAARHVWRIEIHQVKMLLGQVKYIAS